MSAPHSAAGTWSVTVTCGSDAGRRQGGALHRRSRGGVVRETFTLCAYASTPACPPACPTCLVSCSCGLPHKAIGRRRSSAHGTGSRWALRYAPLSLPAQARVGQRARCCAWPGTRIRCSVHVCTPSLRASPHRRRLLSRQQEHGSEKGRQEGWRQEGSERRRRKGKEEGAWPPLLTAARRSGRRPQQTIASAPSKAAVTGGPALMSVCGWRAWVFGIAEVVQGQGEGEAREPRPLRQDHLREDAHRRAQAEADHAVDHLGEAQGQRVPRAQGGAGARLAGTDP